MALTAMTVRADGLVMLFTKGFYYEIHAFPNPSRMEIEVHSSLNGLDVDTAALNRLGIATV